MSDDDEPGSIRQCFISCKAATGDKFMRINVVYIKSMEQQATLMDGTRMYSIQLAGERTAIQIIVDKDGERALDLLTLN